MFVCSEKMSSHETSLLPPLAHQRRGKSSGFTLMGGHQFHISFANFMFYVTALV